MIIAALRIPAIQRHGEKCFFPERVLRTRRLRRRAGTGRRRPSGSGWMAIGSRAASDACHSAFHAVHDAVTAGQRQPSVPRETGPFEPRTVLGFGIGLAVLIDIQKHDIDGDRFDRRET